MKNLNITIIQPDIIWENPQANIEKYSVWIDELENTDLIVLPEMFTTGFSMNIHEMKETMNGEVVEWMKQAAAKKNSAIVGSLIIEEERVIYNRVLWVYPDGRIEKYDKRHLFTMGQEDKNFTQGTEKKIVEYKGWKFCPLICYDLRFPVWSRNTENYDVLIFMANWPSPRHHHWKTLLTARAIENQCYCIGNNRVGSDGMGLSYLGDSGIITPGGVEIFMGEKESTKTFEISQSELQKYRESFPFLNDRDEFRIL